MPRTAVGTDEFRDEARRRLIDTFDLMLALGLRSRTAVWKRVEAGRLPQPVFSRNNMVSLWDRDAIEFPDREEAA